MTNMGKPKLKAAYKATFKGDECLTCDNGSDGKPHQFGTDVRALVLGDAHFPPITRAEGRCIGVVRIASGSPGQLESALIDALGSWSQQGLGKKRKSKGSAVKPEIHVMWAVNSHIMRVGVNCALHDLRISQDMVHDNLGLHFNISSCLILVPNGHDVRAEGAGCNDIHLDKHVTVSKHNHALRLLSWIVMDVAELEGNSYPILVDGFGDVFIQMHVGDEINYDGMDLYVDAKHPVLGNKEDIYILHTF